MTIDEMAREYAKLNARQYKHNDGIGFCTSEEEVEKAYIAGAKENGIQWHDLRKNPNDLPEDTYDVLDQAGYKVHYNFFQNVWVNEKDKIDTQVIAWCEIPKYTEEL